MKQSAIHKNLPIIFLLIIITLATTTLLATRQISKLQLKINARDSASRLTNSNRPLIQDYLPEGLTNNTFNYPEDGLEFSFPANLTLTSEDCSGNYQTGSALVKCQNFSGAKVAMQFLAGNFNPNSNPLDSIASASSSVKATTTTIGRRIWNLEWRRGGPGCDSSVPKGCDDLILYAYTFKGNSAYILSDRNITSTNDSSAELLKTILAKFKII